MKNVFVDSNIWIYAHAELRDKLKHEKAISFLSTEVKVSRIILSIQVLNEFHWILLKKYGIDTDIIAKKIKSIIEISNIMPIGLETYRSAVSLRNKYSISFWDSLIVASALKNDAVVLYSEDMQDGLVIQKKLKVINPLV